MLKGRRIVQTTTEPLNIPVRHYSKLEVWLQQHGLLYKFLRRLYCRIGLLRWARGRKVYSQHDVDTFSARYGKPSTQQALDALPIRLMYPVNIEMPQPGGHKEIPDA